MASSIVSAQSSIQSYPIPTEKRRASISGNRVSIKWRRKKVSKTSSDLPERASARLSLRPSGPSVTSIGTDSNQAKLRIITKDIGGKRQPIPHFRKQLWKHLDKDRDTLNIDLFWPTRWNIAMDTTSDCIETHDAADETGNDMFPIEDLQPLCRFRNLRYLQLNGMLRSYQKYIWQTVWLNPGLEELVLEMALPPTILEARAEQIVEIGKAWTIRDKPDTHYLGDEEEGNLLYSLGEGEYLDQQSIQKAWEAARSLGCTLRFLPIVRLVLAGFVVDAGPFHSWFSFVRLQEIVFKHDCFDAGFGLPKPMHDRVSISAPSTLHTNLQVQRTRLLNFKKSVKMIEIRRGYGDPACSPNPWSILRPTTCRDIDSKNDRDESSQPDSGSEEQFLMSGGLSSEGTSSCGGSSEGGYKAQRYSRFPGKKERETKERKSIRGE